MPAQPAAEPSMPGTAPDPNPAIMHQNDNMHKSTDNPRQINKPVVNPDAPPIAETVNLMQSNLLDTLDSAFEFPTCIKNKYIFDPYFREVQLNPEHYKNFELVEGLMYHKNNSQCILCIPKIILNNKTSHEILIEHAHSLLAHLGARKTLQYLSDIVWWKTMAHDIQKYCDMCHLCKISKSNNHAPYGLLQPLEIPQYPWQSMGVDFVGPLPESTNYNGSFDMICVIIDHLTSLTHLVPCRQTITARQVAELLFECIYKHHGLPTSIVSNRDSLFTSQFWSRFNQLIGIKLKMSSAYHPQTNGATECMNRMVTQMLRQCVAPHQKDWAVKLLAIEFTINAAQSETTGFAPFILNYGRMPRMFIWNSTDHSEYPEVRVFAQRMKDALIAAHDSILSKRTKQVRDANKHRRPAPFTEGDLAYISTTNMSLPKGHARKLAPKFIGPFKILRAYSNESFLVELPTELKRRGLHPVFHTSLLCIHLPNDDQLFPGHEIGQTTSLSDPKPEWAVDKIIVHSGKAQHAIFNVHWKSGDHTWLPFHSIEHLHALRVYLDLLNVSTIRELPPGRPTVDPPQILVACAMHSTPELSPGIHKLDSTPIYAISTRTVPTRNPHVHFAPTRLSCIQPALQMLLQSPPTHNMPRASNDVTPVKSIHFSQPITVFDPVMHGKFHFTTDMTSAMLTFSKRLHSGQYGPFEPIPPFYCEVTRLLNPKLLVQYHLEMLPHFITCEALQHKQLLANLADASVANQLADTHDRNRYLLPYPPSRPKQPAPSPAEQDHHYSKRTPRDYQIPLDHHSVCCKPNSQGSPRWQNRHDIKKLQLTNSTGPKLPRKQCSRNSAPKGDDQSQSDTDSDSGPAPIHPTPSSPALPSYVPQDAIIPDLTIQGTTADPVHAPRPPPPAEHTLVLPLSCELTEVLKVIGTPDSAMSKMSISDPVFNHTDASNPFTHLDPALLQAPFAMGHAAISMPVH